MSILGFLPLIGKITEKVTDIIGEKVEDKDLANELKAEIKQQILINDHEENLELIKGQVAIVLSESKGNFIQRSWRPILMLGIVAIIINNYIFFPYLNLFFPDKALMLELPNGLWALLNVGVGGYVISRGAEKILKKD